MPESAPASDWIVLKFGGTSVSQRHRWDTIGHLMRERADGDDVQELAGQIEPSGRVGAGLPDVGERQRERDHAEAGGSAVYKSGQQRWEEAVPTAGALFNRPNPRDAEGNYTVQHPATVYAFTADNKAHRLYPYGVRQEAWVRDLPKLAVGRYR